jgi:FecR protein
MEPKFRRYYVDWWNIRKSSVYGLIALVVFIGLLVGGAWYASRNNWFSSTGETGEAPKDAAQLISFEGDVRITRAATRDTERVTKPTYIMAGDTIQTQGEGRAQIRMIDGSVLSVKPNSTVVIRDSASVFGGTNVRVALDNGQINLRTEEQTESSQNVVEVKQTENRVYSQTDASFGINPKTSSGEIRISRGGVETNAGGEKTVLKDGEFAAINQNGRLSPKEKLIDSPKLISPSSLEQVLAASNGNADMTFRWQKPDLNAAFTYQIQIAPSPFFVQDSITLEREAITAPTFSVANLSAGTYYWRIRAAAPSGQISEWSEPWKFIIVKREESEGLNVTDWKVETLGSGVYIISGHTQPGVTVRITGRETFAAGDGSFRQQISSAAPETTVEINDEHGNHTRFVLSLSAAKVLRQY